MAKHLCCILLTLPAVAALTTAPLRRSRGRARTPVAQSPRIDASRRHVAILRASDDADDPEPLFDAPPPAPATTNDDKIVAYVAVGSTLVFFGLYAYETLRLMAEGEFYMPHF